MTMDSQIRIATLHDYAKTVVTDTGTIINAMAERDRITLSCLRRYYACIAEFNEGHKKAVAMEICDIIETYLKTI